MPMFPALQYTRQDELYTPISQYFGILTSYAMRTNFLFECLRGYRSEEWGFVETRDVYNQILVSCNYFLSMLFKYKGYFLL